MWPGGERNGYSGGLVIFQQERALLPYAREAIPVGCFPVLVTWREVTWREVTRREVTGREVTAVLLAGCTGRRTDSAVLDPSFQAAVYCSYR